MNHRRARVLIGAVAALLCLPGCALPMPEEKVPEGWALNVHQPGEWWTQPLIPRAVVVQRCPLPRFWASDPDLWKVTALPPGGSIEYSFFTDDYHCSFGWSEAPSTVKVAPGDRATEAGLRRICSASGLPMDAGWRFLGHHLTGRSGEQRPGEVSTAAFIDDHGTVVACFPGQDGEDGTGASVELSVGTDTAAVPGGAPCPVTPIHLGRGANGTVEDYQLAGAGAVRGDDGRVITGAASLRIGLAGDSVTTTHPVVEGIAIVYAAVTPKAAIHFEDWDHPPTVEGDVLDENGTLLATCRS